MKGGKFDKNLLMGGDVFQDMRGSTMDMSDQAKIATIAMVVLMITILIPVKNVDYNGGERIIAMLLLIIPMSLSVYTINCLVGGATGTYCGYWSWFNAGILVVWSAILFAASVYALFYGTTSITGNSSNETFAVGAPYGRDPTCKEKKTK